MTNEEILYMLIGVYVNQKTNKKLAEELSCHRNTISKFAIMHSGIKSDVIEFEKASIFTPPFFISYYILNAYRL